MFGPVLHVLRYKREALNALIDEINASGYALTGGAHSRIDAMIDQVSSRLSAGNLYVNRNIIGAVVGVQPFGGHGLSGTGPKAGGPLYLKRLLARAPARWPVLPHGEAPKAAEDFAKALADSDQAELAGLVRTLARGSRLGLEIELNGPVGERNVYSLTAARRRALRRRQRRGDDRADRLRAELRQSRDPRRAARGGADRSAARRAACLVGARAEPEPLRGGPHRSQGRRTRRVSRAKSRGREGPIASVFRVDADTLRRDEAPLDFLLGERSLCVNTTAAGGNASLMSIG